MYSQWNHQIYFDNRVFMFEHTKLILFKKQFALLLVSILLFLNFWVRHISFHVSWQSYLCENLSYLSEIIMSAVTAIWYFAFISSLSISTKKRKKERKGTRVLEPLNLFFLFYKIHWGNLILSRSVWHLELNLGKAPLRPSQWTSPFTHGKVWLHNPLDCWFHSLSLPS